MDIESRFCELIRRRAALVGLDVDVVNADFFWTESVTEPYDAAVFFECFHHCTDHLRLLRALHRALVPGGSIYFGGEPITPHFPVPWGLRMDGQSLWSIRKHGWFELGFNDDYFAQALGATGWIATKHPPAGSAMAQVWEARKADDVLKFSATDPRLVVPAGTRDERAIRLRGLSRRWGLFGPYAPVSAGRWTARLVLAPGEARSGRGTLDVCHRLGQHVLARRRVDLGELAPGQDCLELDVTLKRPATDVEVRFYCERNVTMSVQRVELVRDGALSSAAYQYETAGNPLAGCRPLRNFVRLARRVAGRCYRAAIMISRRFSTV